MSPPRALVVVTGSELVRGDRRDLNGPFLARELVSLGVDPAEIVIVGDSPQELEAALRAGLGADLCVVSGGLGPTHDDRTVETLARLSGLELVVDSDLDHEIEAVSRRLAERLGRPYADFAAGVRKQATLPVGALPIGLAGTAPGFVIQITSTVYVVLPGPPPELRRLWAVAVENDAVRDVFARGRPPERRTLRFYGVSESAVARALEEAGGDGDGVEATICARDFEIHVDLVVGEAGGVRADAISAALRERLGEFLFSEDERTVAEIVLELCRGRRLTLATAESCTGGLAEGFGLPARKLLDGVGGQAQGTEQAQAFTATDASRHIHTEPSRLCVKSRRTRCSAATVARARTVSRSAGTLKSAASSPSGPAAWR